MSKVRKIEDSVLTVLSAGRCDGPRYYLPAAQLERKLYARTNEVLEALGGKWNRSAKAHVFGEPCEDRLSDAIESGSFAKPSDMGWFPTPAALAERVVRTARIEQGMRVLEPSAGEGALASAAYRAGAVVHCVEIDAGRATKLQSLFLQGYITCADFLSVTPNAVYDRVVMNPPFAKRADIIHVLHARRFLRPDGKLVAIMSGGIEFREDKLSRDFRAQCDSIERLPEGSFSESGTEVRTVVVTMGSG